jgi:hypothetical protein
MSILRELGIVRAEPPVPLTLVQACVLEYRQYLRMARKLDLHEDAVVRYCGSAVAIMGFEYAERDRPAPVYADRCFRVDEPPPTAGH